MRGGKLACEGAAKDEFFWWDERFWRGGFGDCEFGWVYGGELGDGFLFGLDAVGPLWEPLEWLEGERRLAWSSILPCGPQHVSWSHCGLSAWLN